MRGRAKGFSGGFFRFSVVISVLPLLLTSSKSIPLKSHLVSGHSRRLSPKSGLFISLNMNSSVGKPTMSSHSGV